MCMIEEVQANISIDFAVFLGMRLIKLSRKRTQESDMGHMGKKKVKKF